MSTPDILLVYPDEYSSGQIASALGAQGFAVTQVRSGELAIDQFIQQPVDVLVTEMILPGRDGATTAESVRWAPSGQSVTVFLLATQGSTASDIKDARGRTFAAGVYEGPVDPARIAESIVRALGHDDITARRAPLAEDTPLLEDEGTFEDTEAEHIDGVVTDPFSDQVLNAPAEEKTDAQGEPVRDEDEVTRRSRHLSADAAAGLASSWAGGAASHTDAEGQAVTDHALALQSGEASIFGSLGATPFPVVLTRIFTVRANGVLVLENKDDPRRTTAGDRAIKAILFEEGLPVLVHSNLHEESLGPVLSRAGRITPEALRQADEQAREAERSPEDVLLEAGLISPQELEAGLEDQLHGKLFDLFSWSSGLFRMQTEGLSELPGALRREPKLSLGLREIVFRGIIHRMQAGRVRLLLDRHQDKFVVPRIDRCRELFDGSLSDEAQTLLLTLNGEQRLHEFLTPLEKKPSPTAQFLYAFVCLDAIEFSDDPSPTGRLSDLFNHTEETSDQRTILSELRRLAGLLENREFARALGVEGADPQGASIAASSLRRKYRNIGERTSSPQVRRLAREVAVGLSHAEKALTDPDADCGAGEEQPTAVGKNLPNSEAVVVLPGAGAPAPGSPRGHDDPDDFEPTLSEDRSGLTPHTPVESLKAPAPTASFDDSTKDSNEDLEAQQKKKRELDAQVERLYQAERVFRRGRRALDRGRQLEALTCFDEAVELSPHTGEFLAFAGYARHLGDTADHARGAEQLKESCLLSPKVASVFLLRGRAAVIRGEKTLAQDAFRRALDLDPTCAEARKALEGPPIGEQESTTDADGEKRGPD